MPEKTEPRAPAAAAAGRIEAFDAYRGMAIVLVVFAHTAGLGWEYYGVEGGEVNFAWSVAARNLALCSLPMFLFVSGYLLGKVRCASLPEYGDYLRKRVSRIAVPYLFWSLALLSLASIRAGYLDAGHWLFAIITGTADGPYYFILMMLQFYILAPLLSRMLDHRWAMPGFFIVHALWIAGIYAIELAWDLEMHFAITKTPFLSWLSVFTFGMWVRRNPDALTGSNPVPFAAAAVVLYGAAIAETYLLLGFDRFELAILDVRFTTLAFAFAVIMLSLQLLRWNWPDFWVTLGAYSFGIFFIHGTALRAFAKIYAMAGGETLVEMQPVYQTLVALSTLSVCVIAIAAARRILPETVWSRVLGF